jgi:elongation factor P hydroxylase
MSSSPTTSDSPNYGEMELTKYTAFVFKRACRRTVWFAVPNGEKRDKPTGAKLKLMGVRPGVADFILLTSTALALAVELKTLKGRQSEDQKGFQAAWEDNGGVYVIVRTPAEIDGLVFKFSLD